MTACPARKAAFYRNEKALVASGWSSLDGQLGTVMKDSSGPFVLLKMPHHYAPMYWRIEELLH